MTVCWTSPFSSHGPIGATHRSLLAQPLKSEPISHLPSVEGPAPGISLGFVCLTTSGFFAVSRPSTCWRVSRE